MGMKHCPTCNRTYDNESLNFCLKDGMRLINDEPETFNPLATVVSKPPTEPEPVQSTPQPAVPTPDPIPTAIPADRPPVDMPPPFIPIPTPNISPFAETSASIPLEPLPSSPIRTPELLNATPPPIPAQSEPLPTIQASQQSWQQPTPTPTTMPTPPAKKGWFGRNWKWFVPLGCFTMIGAFVGVIALIFFLVVGAIKSTDVYQQALDKAKSNPEVIGSIGQPIKDGMLPQGNINTSGDSGEADFQIPISGPAGSGKIYVEAKKRVGEWEFNSLIVTVDGKDGDKTIDLME
jgi:hypothetical protein